MSRLLEGLTEDQRRAVTVAAPRLRIIAGAGSGKTRVLTHRIAHQAQANVIDPHRTVALTFTRKAAGELRQRLRRLGLRDEVSAGTFHAQAYAQLRTRWSDQGIRAPELLDRRGRVLARVLPRSMSRPDRVAVAAEIDWASASRVAPGDYVDVATRMRRDPPSGLPTVAEYYRAFVDEKRRRKLVDFDDLLELCIRSLADPGQAAAQRWRHRHLFVDEFQDVNRLQFDLLRAWLGPDSTLCVVGDPNQAIYGWNGADSRFLDRFDELFPDSETVRLRDNFRSTPQILAAAAAMSGDGGRLIPHRPDGPPPTVWQCVDDRDEAVTIARRVRDRHAPGRTWSQQAVLVRTNAQTGPIAEALHRAGIPFRVRDGAGLLADPAAAEALDRIARSDQPMRVVVRDLIDDATDAAEAVRRSPEVLDEAAPTVDASGGRGQALATLASMAEDHLAVNPDARGLGFVAWLRATLGGDAADGGRDGVDLVTFHAAKGLEWRVVHLAGIEDGLVPIGRAVTAAAQAEERRLFYVALTRAHDELHITWCANRRFGDRTMQRQASPLLGEMTRTVAGHERAPGGDRSNLERVRALRDALGVRAEHDHDDAGQLREALRAWRVSTARAAGVSAFVVLTDRSLDALVDRRPTTTDELAAVPGFGPVKVARYGPTVLAVIDAHPRRDPDR